MAREATHTGSGKKREIMQRGKGGRDQHVEHRDGELNALGSWKSWKMLEKLYGMW